MQFEVKRKILKLVGATIHTFDPNGQLLCRADQKGFKLKEEIVFYHDDAKTQPLFSIKARNVIDFSATYDISDTNGQIIASMKRDGVSSTFIRDQWSVFNVHGQEVAKVSEDSSTLGFIRRWVDLAALIVPQKFTVSVNNTVYGHIKQNKNPLTIRLSCEFTDQAKQMLGEKLLLAIPNMLAIIEQRQG